MRTEKLQKVAVDHGRWRHRGTIEASSRQLVARWSTATGVLMSASSIRRRLLPRELCAMVPLYRNSFTANHQRCVCNGLMSTEPGKLIGTKLSFQMKSCFNMWGHDGRIRVRSYASERWLPEYVIERHIMA
ncbi:HTH_Tnp_Tc3_2 domain-containing protein [Trichonephila clavipes]|nr:HTH_Tnp_Tc3_2 domain-containing protein [Trichonephila clavipes]